MARSIQMTTAATAILALVLAGATHAQTADGPPAYLVKDMTAYSDSYKAEMDEGGKAIQAAGVSEDAKDMAAACASARTALGDYTKALDSTNAMIEELNKAGDSADAGDMATALPDLTSLVNDSQATADRTCKS